MKLKQSTSALLYRFRYVTTSDRNPDGGQLFLDVEIEVLDRCGLVQGTMPIARLLRGRDRMTILTRDNQIIAECSSLGEVTEFLAETLAFVAA